MLRWRRDSRCRIGECLPDARASISRAAWSARGKRVFWWPRDVRLRFVGYFVCLFAVVALVGCNGDNGGSQVPTSAQSILISGTPTTQVQPGQSYSFTPSVSLDTQANISFSVQNKPTWASFSVSTGQLTGTPTASNVGTYPNVVIGVSDGTSSAALAGFTITVTGTNTTTGTATAGNVSGGGTWFGANLPAAPAHFSTTSSPPLPSNTNRGSYYTPGFGGDSNTTLQDALNAAAAATGSHGDVIVLQAGGTYTTSGSFTLPARSGSGWIYMISSDAPEISGSGLPGAGTRVGPSNTASMASIRSSADDDAPIIVRAAGAAYYRLVGLDVELTNANGPVDYGFLFDNGDTALSTLAQHITIDRCYISGSPVYGVTHAVNLDGNYMELTESYVTGVFMAGNADNQAVLVINSTGPYKIHNNYLQAMGETTLFGGADTSLPSPSMPSDITITNNHYYKPYFVGTGSVSVGSATLTIVSVASSFMGVTMIPSDVSGFIPSGARIVKQLTGTPGGVGTYQMSAAATGSSSGSVAITAVSSGKNMVEFKVGQRVLFDSNYLENAGAEGQARSAFTLTALDQSNTNPWYALLDFSITNNVFTNAMFGGLNIKLQDNPAGSGNGNTQPSYRILFRNNIFILSASDGSSSTAMSLVSSNLAGSSEEGGGFGGDLIFDHNTFIATPTKGANTVLYFAYAAPLQLERSVWSNNIFDKVQYEFQAGSSPSSYADAVPTQSSPASFINNVLIGNSDNTVPNTNFSPATDNAVDFMSYGSNTSAAGYALKRSSPYRGRGVSGLGLPHNSRGRQDGTDIGANIYTIPKG